ncbi:hypothetical protein PFISCL1PPCAC_14382, partial [Pristionchus fissidentatus]
LWDWPLQGHDGVAKVHNDSEKFEVDLDAQHFMPNEIQLPDDVDPKSVKSALSPRGQLCISALKKKSRRIREHCKRNRQSLRYRIRFQTELIKYWGYPVESYDVITEDGYILNMIRIPHGRYHDLNTSECARSPILLIHGIFNDASVFILNPPASSPALILADAGFDVFLPNSRGTTDSQRHVNISTKDVQFWRFTIDEMSRYDTPAAIDKALELSRAESLYLLGHSQGTTIGSMALTERPEYNKKVDNIRAMFQLAPAGPNHQLRGFMRLLVAVFKAIRP